MFEDNMMLFTLRAHVRTLTNPRGEDAPFKAVKKEGKSLMSGCCTVDRGSLAFFTAAAVVLEKQQKQQDRGANI